MWFPGLRPQVKTPEGLRMPYRLFARPSLRLALVASARSGDVATDWLNYASRRRRNGDCSITASADPWKLGRWGRYVELLAADTARVLSQFTVSGWLQGTFIGLVRQPTEGTSAWIATDADPGGDDSIRWSADNTADRYVARFPNVAPFVTQSPAGTVVWNEWVMLQLSWGMTADFELLGTQMYRDGVLIHNDATAVVPRATTNKLRLASAQALGEPSPWADLHVAFFGVWKEWLGGWASRALMAGRSRVAA